MSFLRDRLVQNFSAGVLGILLLMAVLDLAGGAGQRQAVQELFVSYHRNVASSLLEQGVPPETVAAALTGGESLPEADELLRKIGLDEKTAPRFFPPVSDFQKRSGGFRWVKFALVSGLLLGLLAWFFTRREKDYRYATRVAGAYIEGDFSQSLPQTNEGALSRLYSTVSQLASALQSKHEAEHQAKEFLKETISDISHQLKTPLAALEMYQEIIAGEPDHCETVSEFAQKSADALARMEGLIQSMLKIARLDAGGIIFKKERILVSELVAEAAGELLVRAEREKKELRFSGPEDAELVCDPQWTCEAVGNLIKNALDHTAEGGRIRVEWERLPAMVRISVTDDGRGISPEDFYHIFKRFYRSRSAQETQGVGLGLPLAKSIVEGQGGTVAVQTSLNEGTAFRLSFLSKL